MWDFYNCVVGYDLFMQFNHPTMVNDLFTYFIIVRWLM